MKRILVCALALAGLACSDSGKAPGQGRGGSGGTASTATSSGGASVTSNASGGSASSGATTGSGGAKVTETGGSTSSGGGRTGAGGRTTSDADGGPVTGNGGRTTAHNGGATTVPAGGVSANGGATGTGGRTGAGGRTTPGIDGGSSVGGNSGGIAVGPTIVDVTTVATGLPAYYISKTGDDSQAGTSPETAWATVKNIPKDKASVVYFEKGGTYSNPGAPAKGRDGPSAFTMPKGSVWTAYGDGDKRPILWATEGTAGKVTGAVLQPSGNNVLEGISINGRANFGILLMSDNNVVQNCEIDGNIKDTQIQLGFSVRGKGNRVIGNYIHSLHVVILDNGSVNTSGGAEAIVVNGTDHEIAYNTIDDCWTPNETLGGAEGGCLEIIARTPGEVVENVTFHHNHCSHSVGLFEACAGNFAGTSERIQEHHAVVRNTTLAYNVVMDAMWMYLLQTVNTDMDKLIFEHNTLVHTAANDEVPQRGAPGFGNFYDTDMWVEAAGMTPAPKSCTTTADCGGVTNAFCMGSSCAYQTKAQPGQIIVRNNLFVVLGGKAATMKMPPGPDDVVNNIFAPKAPSGLTAAAGKIIVVSDAGLVTDSYKLTASSPAVDKASTTTVKPWPDIEGSAVPCGSAPDVGAFELCQ